MKKYETNKYQPFEHDRVLRLRANNCAVESESVSVMPRDMLYKNCNTVKKFSRLVSIQIFSAWLSVFTVLFRELCYLTIRSL
jgi:hypothetical protein